MYETVPERQQVCKVKVADGSSSCMPYNRYKHATIGLNRSGTLVVHSAKSTSYFPLSDFVLTTRLNSKKFVLCSGSVCISVLAPSLESFVDMCSMFQHHLDD